MLADVEQAERLAVVYLGPDESYAVVDTKTDDKVARIYHHRKIVVVAVEAPDTWLTADLADQVADRLRRVAAAAREWEAQP